MCGELLCPVWPRRHGGGPPCTAALAQLCCSHVSSVLIARALAVARPPASPERARCMGSGWPRMGHRHPKDEPCAVARHAQHVQGRGGSERGSSLAGRTIKSAATIKNATLCAFNLRSTVLGYALKYGTRTVRYIKRKVNLVSLRVAQNRPTPQLAARPPHPPASATSTTARPRTHTHTRTHPPLLSQTHPCTV